MNKRAPSATVFALIFKESLDDYENVSTLGVNLYKRLAYFDPIPWGEIGCSEL